MNEFLKLLGGLLLFMTANILLGTKYANLKNNFNKEKMISGVSKCIFIALGVSALYSGSYLNPDIVVANINGINVNTIKMMEFIFISGQTMYGFKAGQNLIKLFNLKISLLEIKEKENIKIPIENEIKRGE